MDNEHAVPGVADAGAHGTMLTDAVSNTTLLAHYVRDREAQMPIEMAVYKSCLAAAEIYGLTDRGVLAPGMKAECGCFPRRPVILTTTARRGGGTSVGTPRPVAVLLLIFIFLLPLLSLRQTYWRKIHLGLRPVVDARRGGGHRLAGLLEGCLVALLCSHLHREALLPRQPGDRGRRRV